jgi:hypothetical protein
MSDVLGRLDEPPAPVPRLAPGSSQAAAVAAAALAEADAAATAAGVVVREAGSRAELTRSATCSRRSGRSVRTTARRRR